MILCTQISQNRKKFEKRHFTTIIMLFYTNIMPLFHLHYDYSITEFVHNELKFVHNVYISLK